MESYISTCILCKTPIEGNLSKVTVRKGIQKIIECSFHRKDSLHLELEGKSFINVHIKCRKNYTRPTSINASLSAEKSALEEPNYGITLRNSVTKFDFKNDCFICGRKCSLDVKYPSHRRKAVYNVSSMGMRNNTLRQCELRNDEWGNDVRSRIFNVIDLVAAKARYHNDCYKNFFYKKSEKLVGRPKREIEEAFLAMCDLIDHSDECQFTLKELQHMMSTFLPEEHKGDPNVLYTDRHLKDLLKQHFGDRIVISNVSGRKNIFCFSETVYKIIEKWYKDRASDLVDERKRIVQAAADIIKEDIQKMVYESNTYPELKDVTDREDLIPQSLKLFTDRITSKKSVLESEKVKKKAIVINHAIISSVRPRSFISPIQTGLALTLHRLFGSKYLIDLLSSLGLCASYHETNLYLSSLIAAGSPNIGAEAFTQFVFDNADVNVRTLDGLNTFHAMGGVQCITPGSSVDTKVTVQKVSSAGAFNQNLSEVRIMAYPNKKRQSSSILIDDFTELRTLSKASAETRTFLYPVNIVWMAGVVKQPGWNGLMNILSSTIEPCESTHVMALPFINLDPSNMSTIYSALSFAADQCRKRNQCCIVTFDQPLYLKATEIVERSDDNSDLSKVILRLGGFHLLMSFMGSVGRIMEGSGLESLWETVYGSSTVNHMLSGHAYSRAIRAYSLTAASLVTIMREEYPNIDLECKKLEEVHEHLIAKDLDFEQLDKDEKVTEIIEELEHKFEEVKSSSRTAKLWLNLLLCIDLILKFIFAERTGNWKMHLSTIVDMLPYFHAAAHLPYAKSAHLYVQQMLKLENKLSREEYKAFTDKGYFTIRRSGKYWSGTWTDMIIEQCLMRPMKAVGGLTHGRGISNSTLSKWIHGSPYCLKVQEALDEFAGTSLNYTEQHVELRESRKKRDTTDLEKFNSWFRQHNPFTKVSGDLVALHTGFVSDESVNCDKAYEVGLAAMQNMKGKSFGELKLKRKDMVITQANYKSTSVRSLKVNINTQQLFNRILCVSDCPDKLKTYLEYELASLPPSIFDDASLRKGTKSSIVKLFSEGIVEQPSLESAGVVVDGGFLIHYVAWPNDATYGEIVKNYSSFVLSKYGHNTTVVFDGYPDEATTKDEEHRRRSLKYSSYEIQFNENTKCVTKKEHFLSNKKNKIKLIESICKELDKSGIKSITADDDADTEVVNAGIKALESFSKSIVVGNDTDILILLIALAPENKAIYFRKDVGGRNPSSICYDIVKLKSVYKNVVRLMLFAHAVSGCDTTSYFFGVGKIKAVELIKANDEAKHAAEPFLNQSSSKDTIATNGERFVLLLYGLSKFSNLNEARYYSFTRITKKSSLKSDFELAKLPPTSEACHQHLFRVYLQVQSWLGNKLRPTDWGWRYEQTKNCDKQRKILRPVISMKPMAPDNLLSMVSCSCKTGCGLYCGCRKSGFTCSAMCEHCNGLSCTNPLQYHDDFND